MKAAAVAIGVGKTGGLTPLAGATRGAEDFAEWAKDQKMDVTLITDRDGPVSVRDLRRAIKPIVDAKTYEKLVVFFAGHGFLNAQTELWLLSDAPEWADEAVNVELSRDFARYSGIPHVIFVSDACRSGGPSHRHRQVTGSAIFPVPPDYDEDGEVDTFYGTRPGDPALEYKTDQEAADNYKGVFTECLLDALGPGAPEMVEVVTGSDRRYVVPCRPLKKLLRQTVPLKAEDISIKLSQDPEVRVESALPRYFGVAKAGTRSGDRGGTRGGTLGGGPRRGPKLVPLEATLAGAVETLRSGALSGTGTRGGTVRGGGAAPSRTEALRRIEDEMEVVLNSRGRPGFETAAGFTVYDRVQSVTLGAGVGADLWQEGELSHVRVDGAAAEDAAAAGGGSGQGVSILLELSDGTGTVLAVKPQFVGTVLLEEGRVVNVNYTPSTTSSLYREEYEHVAERVDRRRAFAATAARHGVFELEDAEAAGDFLRMGKRLDPTLGIYAAYAYRQSGKIRAVRDVLRHMASDLPPVPFDLPLLAHQGEPWPAFAPFCPMLSQGWALLELQPSAALAFQDLRSFLVPALWTQLNPEGVDEVRQRLQRGDLQ